MTATTPSTAALRHDLALLRAQYDSGASQPGVYAIIRALEIEIAWIEHAERFGVPINEWPRNTR
jgi:hypothetical protein